MKNNKHTTFARVAVPFVALVAVLAPTTAFAEGAADKTILEPKPAEFVPALIAFLIIWAVLAKFVWPTVLKNLDARQLKIQEDLDSAAETKIQSERELDAYRAKISDADKKAEEIIAAAKRAAEDERARIKAQAQDEATEIIERAREAMENERKSAMAAMTSQAADLSLDIAEKILEENLDAEKQNKLIEKYLQEVGSLNAK